MTTSNTTKTALLGEAERFAQLKAAFAERGHTLHQSGPTSYLAERWGLARYLPALDDAERFLKQIIGGRHGL
jgi:hypothetical protein